MPDNVYDINGKNYTAVLSKKTTKEGLPKYFLKTAGGSKVYSRAHTAKNLLRFIRALRQSGKMPGHTKKKNKSKKKGVRKYKRTCRSYLPKHCRAKYSFKRRRKSR